jgi:carboxypeptidase family protein
MKKYLCVLFAITTALLCASSVWGQARGSFSGSVSDKSGAVISGASVTAISQGTGVARQARTDDAGHYVIPLLPVGFYTLRVEVQGFRTAETKDLRLQVDEARELDFTLSPSTVTSQVEVSANAVAVETTNPSLGQVITAQEVSQLPLNGRDFVQLATLTPGTTQETAVNSSFFNGGASSEVSARGSVSLSVGGSRPNVTDWLLDGNDNNELTAGGIGILSSIDAIQEFKVLTYNYSAEYGTRAGPTVLVTTKSGSNHFHGSLFEFLRNTSLDAKSFFATSPEKFNLNQFGGSVGGPIKKGKTFFFVDGEQKYQRRGITFTGVVPTDAMKAGDFSKNALLQTSPIGATFDSKAGKWVLPGGAIYNPNVGFLNDPMGADCRVPGSTCGTDPSSNPALFPNIYFQCDPISGAALAANSDGSQPAGVNCNKIPNGLINPLGAKLLALYPEPNANNPSSFTNFVNEPVRRLEETKFDVRLDHNFSSSDNAFARFSYDQASSYVPGGGGIGNFTESFFFASNQGILNHGRNIALSETHIFSPNTVNQVSGGYNRIFNYITSQGSGTCTAAKFGIPGANLDCGTGTCAPGGVSCGLTSAQVLGPYFAVGDRGFSPFTGGTNVFSISDSLDMIRGKHDIKVGVGIRAQQMNVRTEGLQDGLWTMSGLWTGDPEADFLLGLTSLAIHDQTFKGSTTGRRWKIFRPFVQDDWRLTKNITLNLGLAWNLTSPISEVDNRQADFNPANGQFLISGQGADKYAGIQWDKTAFEPRIGLAWKPWGSDKTAVRAGYAIYHDSSWNMGAQGLWQNPPYFAESDLFAFGGACTFATANCHTVHNLAPSAVSISQGFQVFTAPPIPASFTGNLLAQNTDFKLGKVQQFNINVEHQLPGQIVLTVGYAGSRGSDILTYGNNLNVATPSACGKVSGYTRGCGPGGTFIRQPYQAFCSPFGCSTVFNITSQGSAHYNGLQIKAETKSSRNGIYALIGYTYSRTYDTGFTDGLGSIYGATYYPLPGFRKLDWALSGINLNNNFTASVVYDLPLGKGKHFGSSWSSAMNSAFGNWQVTLIEKITSGFPVYIVDTSNPSGVSFLNNDFFVLARPDEVGDPNKAGPVSANPTCTAPTQVHTAANWFNPCAFAHAAPGELGNASRTPLSGPDFVNTDFSVIKQFALPWENMGLNFRVEFFNLFNHTQFGTPNSAGGTFMPDLNAPGFGALNTTVNNPRLVQFGLKLTF